jgi:tetratricopeptide (TPR) repeat protein
LYNEFGQEEKSWALLERIRPFLPGDPQVSLAEANTWMNLGKPTKAIPLLESALATQPNDAVMKQFYGWGLLSTGQYERAAEVGHPWHKAIALNNLGRPEEALMITQDLAAEGNVGPLINMLNQKGEPEELVKFVESHWPDLDAFETEYPDSGTGYSEMLSIAHAYSQVGNEAKFNDAMARVRTAHDRSNDQGMRANYYLKEEARYYVMAGDRERAIDMMSLAIDEGWMMSVRFEQAWPELQVLAGDPAYEAVVTRMFGNMNAERTEMGLEPISS